DGGARERQAGYGRRDPELPGEQREERLDIIKGDECDESGREQRHIGTPEPGGADPNMSCRNSGHSFPPSALEPPSVNSKSRGNMPPEVCVASLSNGRIRVLY